MLRLASRVAPRVVSGIAKRRTTQSSKGAKESKPKESVAKLPPKFSCEVDASLKFEFVWNPSLEIISKKVKEWTGKSK